MKKLILLISIISLFTSHTYAKSKTIAIVNGTNITLDDIQVIMASSPNARFDTLSSYVKDQVISKAIDKELLTAIALKSNIKNSEEYKTSFKIFKKNLIFNLWLKQEAQKMKLKKNEIKKYYKDNKSVFAQKASVKASHILVKDEKSAKNIIKALGKSKNLSKAFISMAKEKSTGPSSVNGGSLGWFEKGKMVPEFSKAAFALKKNSITKKPIKTQFGYHIIYLEDKKNGGIQKLSQVKEQISNALKAKKFQVFMEKRTKSLREKAKIKILK